MDTITNNWIEENYVELLDITKNLSGQIDEDALHYALTEFLTKDNHTEIVQTGGAKFYIISILLRCFRSPSHPFYRQRNEHTQELVYDPAYEEYEGEFFMGLTDSVVWQYLDNVFWYDREIFCLYMFGGYTYQTLSKETGISRTSLNGTVNKVKSYLKQQITQEIERRKQQ